MKRYAACNSPNRTSGCRTELGRPEDCRTMAQFTCWRRLAILFVHRFGRTFRTDLVWQISRSSHQKRFAPMPSSCNLELPGHHLKIQLPCHIWQHVVASYTNACCDPQWMKHHCCRHGVRPARRVSLTSTREGASP